jgi:hypothetical protein
VFCLSCPVCREVEFQIQIQYYYPYKYDLQVIGESRYNLAELLAAQPPLAAREEPPQYKVSDEMRKLQQKMKRLYSRHLITRTPIKTSIHPSIRPYKHPLIQAATAGRDHRP